MAVDDAIRVGVVEDHDLVRTGILFVLEKEPDIAVVGEARNYAEAKRLLEQGRPDVILLDMQLQDVNGLAICEMVKDSYPSVAVVVLSAFLSTDLLRECRRLGASGYLLKDAEHLELASAVRICRAGGTVFDKRAQSLLEGLAFGGEEGAALTKREYEVLRLAGTGMTNQEIAQAMDLSLNAVKSYLSETMRKLSARNRVEMILAAQDRHLL